jgi:diaminohydroxyphosphoribosylaminopyrimidine deaminase/5-amino-6-(5-phosphoribosylamino)uracil reductase
VGIETVLADDPELTCRLPGVPVRPPARIVFDSRLRLPLHSKLVAGAKEMPVMVVCSAGADAKREKALRDRGITVLAVEAGEDGRPDPRAAMSALGSQGLTRVMVEGGAGLAAALLRARLVDRIVWFRAPSLIGGDGLPATGSIAVDALGDAPSFVRVAIAETGPDLLETYARPT